MAKCPNAKKWKRRYKDAVSASSAASAKAFERQAKLQAQLRAIDHIILERELPGPTPAEWMDQARELMRDLVTCRAEEREEGYSKRDLEQAQYKYQEHFQKPMREAMAKAFDVTPLRPFSLVVPMSTEAIIDNAT
jgi:hypothetical protein